MSYHDNSIRFPPGTISSKLDSKLLKKPPSPIDWIHQSYLEMIQDVSYDTSHYYESLKGRTEPIKPGSTVVIDLGKIQSSSTLHHQQLGVEATKTPSIQEEEKDTRSKENYDDDDDSEYCNTNTTTSTDYNRKNNIYRYYREQQNIDRPFDDDEPVFPTTTLRIMTPYSSSSIAPSMIEESHNLNLNSSNSSKSSVVTGEEDIKLPNQQPYKKKFKMIGNLITKMRITAEKPFWSIDNHF